MTAAKKGIGIVSRLHGWLQLFRLPNWFTVPGEPLAGYALAGGLIDWTDPSLQFIVGAALCIYIAGVAWNDYFDRWEDRHKKRPRPLPMGRVSPAAALIAGCVWAIAGVALCYQVGMPSFWIGLLLAACVFSYSWYMKRIPGLGVFTMGACRGLSVLLGASAVTVLYPYTAPVWAAAGVVTVYIAAVTRLARRDDVPHNPGAEIWYPFVVLLIGLCLFMSVVPHEVGWSVGFWSAYGAALLLVFVFGVRMQGFTLSPNLPKVLERKAAIVRELPRWIGWLIANLLFLNAAFILAVDGREAAMYVVGALWAGWLLNRVLVIWFDPS